MYKLKIFVMRTLVSILGISLIIFILSSCKSEVTTNDDAGEIKDTTAVVNEHKENIVFIGLPSPIETSLILQRAKVEYDDSFLNPPENRENYSSSFSQALNLGIYSADMCLASMYNRSQKSAEYLTAIKKMSEDLGIMDVVDKSIFDRMENNANEKDSLMHILSEVTMNAEISLKESDRKETASTILIGGWIEGLYIITQIAKSSDNEELYMLIGDHRLSLGSLFKMLDEYPENEDFIKLRAELEPLKVAFDKLNVISTDIKVKTDIDAKTTTLSSENKAEMTEEALNEIATVIKEIRNKITEGQI